MKNLFFTLFLLSSTFFNTYAQDSTATKLQITGYVDAYYQYNFNGVAQAKTTSFSETNNSFTLGMANVKLAKNVKKAGFVADLGFGPRADAANGYANSTSSIVKQLYVTYAPTEKLKFTFGNFATHIGYELIDATGNLNYSTSYAFSKGPFYHTGLKAEYVLSSNLTGMIGGFNDTDRKFDFDASKHIGGQLAYTKGNLKLYLNYLDGKIEEDTSLLHNRQWDVTASLQATEKLGLGLNLTQKYFARPNVPLSNWTSGALYANVWVRSNVVLVARGEYFIDMNGEAVGVTDDKIFDLTLSANIKLDGLTIIPEIRYDQSTQAIFSDHLSTKKNSPSFLVAVVYAF